MSNCPVCNTEIMGSELFCNECRFDLQSSYTEEDVISHRLDYWETLYEFTIRIGDTTTLEKVDNIHQTDIIRIPYGVTGIGRYAFLPCRNATTVIVPCTVVGIHPHAFESSSIEEIIFEENSRLGIIASEAFSHSNITRIRLPKSVRCIQSEAFSFSELISFECEPGINVEFFGKNVFANSSSLEEVQLPYGIRNIEWGLFDSCTSLRDISIPETVTSIEGFSMCENLYLLPDFLPDSVETITGFNSEYWFMDDEELSNSIFPKNLKRVGCSAFSHCDYFKSIFFHDDLERIESWAFSDCSRLELAIVPEHTQIEENAFPGCQKDFQVVRYSIDWDGKPKFRLDYKSYGKSADSTPEKSSSESLSDFFNNLKTSSQEDIF